MIVGREMIDDLPDPEPIDEKKNTRKMARMTRMARMARMARSLARMARWLADLADPFIDRTQENISCLCRTRSLLFCHAILTIKSKSARVRILPAVPE